MTARPLEPRQPFPRVARAIFVALGVVSACFAACTTTNDPLFEDTGIGDLAPVSPGNGGSGGGAALPVLTSPPSRTPMDPALTDPSAVGGSGGTGSTPRPPAADAGVTPPTGDAGADPTIPMVGDDSCGAQCALNGGLCAGGTCFFDCQAPGSCASRQVICPSGVPCDVTCGDRACTSNVLCSVNSVCNIRCQGERSCAAELICEGTCNVICSGANSCPGGTGGAAQLLNLHCTGRQSCGSTVQCEGQACEVECAGQQSCERVKIFGAQNKLVCSGAGSCDTDVSCNGTSCGVECARDACPREVDCQALTCQVGELERED
jgi:hypothetical protein